MIKLILPILFFISSKAYSQANQYVATWTGLGFSQYILQSSTNNKTWKNVATISSNVTDSSFSYTVTSAKNIYYRIKAGNYYSNTFLVVNIKPKIVINPSSPIQIKLK